MTAVLTGVDAADPERTRAEPAPEHHRRADGPWGRLPETSLLIASGLFAVSLAYAGGRSGESWAVPVYWVGQLVMFVPPLLRVLISRRVPDRECLGTAMVLGLAYFAAAYCYSPLEFKFIDELQHWRTATDIVQTGHLYSFNDSLPISPVYPGLESVSTSVGALTGLSVFASGVAVMCVVRVLLTGSLFLLFREVTGSARVAALASILFTTAPYYKSILAKFIYGSMALPFLVLGCYAVIQALSSPRDRRRVMTCLAAVCLAVTVVTHHLTSWILAGVLVVATLVFSYEGDRGRIRVVAGLAATSVALAGIWILAVAPETPAYLSPAVTDLADGIAGALSGRSQPSDGGFVRAPLAEALPSYLSVLLISACVVACAWWVWRHLRANPWVVAMTVAALGYLAVPVVRVVSSSGSEDAVRAQTYLFIPLSLVLALGGLALIRRAGRRRWAVAAAATVATIAMVGGITSGWPPSWGRIPADHMVVDGYENAVDPQGVAAAFWAQGLLPPGQRISADDTNYTLMGPYGQQSMVSGTAELYDAPELREADRAHIAADRIQYLVADHRLSRQLPAGGSYFPEDPRAHQHTVPLPLSGLTKFDHIDGVRRLFDSGDIVVYDLRGLDGAP